MKHWLRLHWLALTSTLKYMLASPFTACLNMLVIGLALSLPVGLFVILSNGYAITSTLPVDPQLTIFTHIDATLQERNALKQMLSKHADIDKVRFIDKAQGLKELAEHSGMTELLGGLESNPLPDAFVVTLKDPHPAKLEALQHHISEENGVESVLADSAWAKRLMAVFMVGEISLIVLAIGLGAGLILITGNSIRMQILTRVEEIEVSKLIGATDAFIRRPFLYFAILQGIVGSLLACSLVGLALYYVNPSIRAFAALYNIQFTLAGPQPLAMTAVCIIATVLCLLSAVFAVGRHLRRLA